MNQGQVPKESSRASTPGKDPVYLDSPHWIMQSIQTLHGRIDTIEDRFDRRIGRMEKRFDRRFSAITKRLRKVETKISVAVGIVGVLAFAASFLAEWLL